MKNILIVIISLLITGCDKSFEDCILENMKGASSNVAAFQIRQACIEKYGKPAGEIRDGLEKNNEH